MKKVVATLILSAAILVFIFCALALFGAGNILSVLTIATTFLISYLLVDWSINTLFRE